MTAGWQERIASVEAVSAGLDGVGYIPTPRIATAVFLAQRLAKPILVEGPAGVGKTELARATAAWLGLPLVRLQCYEGLDEARALYEWKYGKQLLYTQLLRDRLGATLAAEASLDAAMAALHGTGDLFYSDAFLEPRPLLRALREPHGAVLLIDEVDKADEAFEAFLLELLADWAVTIPELGPVRAVVPPLAVLTSNAVRDLGDALKRRCLHLHIGLPDAALEGRIVASRVPGIADILRAELVAFVQALRGLEFRKLPSISETIDWARALVLLHARELDATLVRDTLNLLLKFESDVQAAEPRVPELLAAARKEADRWTAR